MSKGNSSMDREKTESPGSGEDKSDDEDNKANESAEENKSLQSSDLMVPSLYVDSQLFLRQIRPFYASVASSGIWCKKVSILQNAEFARRTIIEREAHPCPSSSHRSYRKAFALREALKITDEVASNAVARVR
ncbi:hypothetical protein BDR07DRAFT_1372155 [Suillus spraguei]|nr:hypothetical protein BDR07DRAFT_1466405 [Suillus spraguei]KAG2368367.1 hypothetical protein BDR07DRAFT_1372155 [Suillus spraguei]